MRAMGDPGAGRVMDRRSHAVELFNPAVSPTSGAVVEAPVPVRVLLDDQEDLVVVEGQWQIQPPHSAECGVRPAGRFRLADGPDTLLPCATAHRGRRLDIQAVTVDVDPA